MSARGDMPLLGRARRGGEAGARPGAPALACAALMTTGLLVAFSGRAPPPAVAPMAPGNSKLSGNTGVTTVLPMRRIYSPHV